MPAKKKSKSSAAEREGATRGKPAGASQEAAKKTPRSAGKAKAGAARRPKTPSGSRAPQRVSGERDASSGDQHYGPKRERGFRSDTTTSGTIRVGDDGSSSKNTLDEWSNGVRTRSAPADSDVISDDAHATPAASTAATRSIDAGTSSDPELVGLATLESLEGQSVTPLPGKRQRPWHFSSTTKLQAKDVVIGALKSVIGDHPLAKELIASVERVHDRELELSRLHRRLTHDYKTIMETVREISLKGLDIPRFEQYTINTIRGQFGVPDVLFLRQAEHFDDTLAVHTARLVDAPPVSVRLDSDLAHFLAKHGDAVSLTPPPRGLRDDPNVKVLRTEGIALLVPLVKKDEQGELTLKGLLGLGPRIGNVAYSEHDCEFLGLLGSIIGISLHNAHLYHRSIVDGLTQVFTRGYFDIHIEQEVDRTRRFNHTVEAEGRGEKTGLTLVLLDIDHFKQFNDQHSHLTGDLVLNKVADTLREAVRAMDVVCRYGGEEFGIIFPDATSKVAVPIAERMRKTVEQLAVETADHARLQVTVSLGVATYPDDADSVYSLIRSADDALYRAKAEGRNRVVAAHDIAASPATAGERPS